MGASFVLVTVLSFAACCFSASADPVHFTSELEILAHEELRLIVDSLVNEKFYQMSGKPRLLGGFSYTNCADPSKEVVVVSNMTIKPDPIKLPGNLSISFDSIIKSKFGAPLSAKLEVETEIVGVWIKVPCVDNIGSCTYDDMCAQLAKLITTCPSDLVKQGFTCRCPISPTKISLKDYTVPLNIKVPSIVSGGIKVKIELSAGSTYITCMQIQMELA